MKIVITESQKKIYHNFIKSYMDGLLEDKEVAKVDTEIIIWGAVEDPYVDNNSVLMSFDGYDGRLYVNKNLINLFNSIGPIDKEELESIIKNSFEEKFGVNVKYIK